jgi:amino acid transporter
MGWDNASTIAHEVKYAKRTYIKAMLVSVTVVLVSYMLPIAAVWRTGLDPNSWTTGGWVDVARIFGGKGLAITVMLGGALATMSTFNALVLSLSRLPSAMARDGFLPKVFAKENRRGVPYVAVIVFAVIWGLCIGIGFGRNVMLDVMLTGLSLVLEFVALIVFRIREPQLARVFRIPGGLPVLVLLSIPTIILVAITMVRNYSEMVGPVNALSLGMALVVLGPLVYFLKKRFAKAKSDLVKAEPSSPQS